MMCPQIEFSCCPAYEQFKMFKNFNTNIKPSFILLDLVIKKSLTLLGTEVTALVASGKIDADILAVTDPAAQLRLQYAWTRIKALRPQAIFSKALKYQQMSSNYVAAWKSAFYCAICDLTNQNFIDLNKQTITYSASSCDALVKNTLLYANLLNTVIVKYLATLSGIIWRLSGRKGGQKLHSQSVVNKAINDCAADFKQYDSGLSNCKAYCEYFNLAQDSFVLEGYPEFFANTLVDIRTYVNPAAAGTAAPAAAAASARRLIEESVKGLLEKSRQRNQHLLNTREEHGYFKVNLPKNAIFKGFETMRLLQEDKDFNELIAAQKRQRKLQSRRILADAIDWTFDPLDPSSNITITVEIFERTSVDFNFDEADMGRMVDVQEIMNTGDPITQKKLIALYFVNNYQTEMDDINAPNVFKETTQIRVDFTQFRSKVSFSGINMDLIVGMMPWNVPFKEIGLSLTATSAVATEMIYPDVIAAVNTVSNNDIMWFHEDQYIGFKKPHFQMYGETMRQLIKDFALKRLQVVIAQKMAVYNYLVATTGQSSADSLWSELETLQGQLTGLTNSPGSYQVTTYNYTDSDGTTYTGMNITSPTNASGYANVTQIKDVNRSRGDYETISVIVNAVQNANYLQNNPVVSGNGGGANAGGYIGGISSGGGQNGGGQNGNGQNRSGQNGNGQNGNGQNGNGQNGNGQNGNGQNGGGQNGSGQNGGGQNGSGQNGSGQNGGGQNGSGQNRSGRRSKRNLRKQQKISKTKSRK